MKYIYMVTADHIVIGLRDIHKFIVEEIFNHYYYKVAPSSKNEKPWIIQGNEIDLIKPWDGNTQFFSSKEKALICLMEAIKWKIKCSKEAIAANVLSLKEVKRKLDELVQNGK